MNYPHERAFYRVVYPILARPRLIIASSVFEVLDCSERGLRYRDPGEPPHSGSTFTGLVRFQTGAEVPVSGEIIRIQAEEIAVRLGDPGLPLSIVLDEQRFLRARFPLRAE